MLDILIPFGMIFFGIIGVTIYCLTIALRESLRRLSEMNRDLMILLGARDSKNANPLSALVAANRKPRGDIPGVAAEKKKEKEEPKGYKVTVGAR